MLVSTVVADGNIYTFFIKIFYLLDKALN